MSSSIRSCEFSTATSGTERKRGFAGYNSICLVKQSMLDKMAEDFYTIDFMEAYEQLGYIIGEALEDDLVN